MFLISVSMLSILCSWALICSSFCSISVSFSLSALSTFSIALIFNFKSLFVDKMVLSLSKSSLTFFKHKSTKGLTLASLNFSFFVPLAKL